MIKNVWVVYFSPAGSTQKVARHVANAAAEILEIAQVQEYDWTQPMQREKILNFGEEDLVIVASPTYAGRIPNKIMPFVRDNLSGNGAVGVAIVTYGNRSYDDSLKEMCLLMQANGFIMAGGGAAVCRHVMSKILAEGRPTEEDLREADAFGRALAEKLNKLSELSVPGNDPVGPYYRPLEEDGRPASFLKAKPKLYGDLCNRCGICASACPMGSISAEDVAQVTGVCIKCQACVLKCPTHARYFDDPSLLSHIRMLESNYSNKRRDNEWY